MEKTITWYLENSLWVDAVLNGSYRLERQGTGRKTS
jgi:dTDP-D-glucose 4,6-dehydratase